MSDGHYSRWAMTWESYSKKLNMIISLDRPLDRTILRKGIVTPYACSTHLRMLCYAISWPFLPLCQPTWKNYLKGSIGFPFQVIHLHENIIHVQGQMMHNLGKPRGINIHRNKPSSAEEFERKLNMFFGLFQDLFRVLRVYIGVFLSFP